MWKLTWKWARHSHPNKGERRVAARYFGKFNAYREDRWVFGDKDTGTCLVKHPWTAIRGHVMVKGTAPEMDRLRERMGGLGFSYEEIAIEVSRRYPVRPRQAYRLAWGWTLDKVAERFNELAAREGTDPRAVRA